MSQQSQPNNKPAQPTKKPAQLDRALSAHSHAPDSDVGRQPTDPRDPPRPPKLLDQVRQVIRLRHLSASTEKQYIGWIRRYICFHNKQHPAQLGKEQVEQFLSHLAIDGNVAASTQNQALSALLLWYREVLKVNLPWLTDVIRARRPKCFSADEAAFTGQCRGSLRGPMSRLNKSILSAWRHVVVRGALAYAPLDRGAIHDNFRHAAWSATRRMSTYQG